MNFVEKAPKFAFRTVDGLISTNSLRADPRGLFSYAKYARPPTTIRAFDASAQTPVDPTTVVSMESPGGATFSDDMSIALKETGCRACFTMISFLWDSSDVEKADALEPRKHMMRTQWAIISRNEICIS